MVRRDIRRGLELQKIIAADVESVKQWPLVAGGATSMLALRDTACS